MIGGGDGRGTLMRSARMVVAAVGVVVALGACGSQAGEASPEAVAGGPPTTLLTTIPLTAGVAGQPAVLPDGSAIYMPTVDGSVAVIDTTTQRVTATIAVGEGLGSPAVLPDGSSVYVPTGTESVSVIDTASHKVTDTIPVGEVLGSQAPVVTPDGSAIYVPTSLDTMSVIDTASNTVKGTIPVRDPADDMGGDVAMLPDGSAVYVINRRSATITVIATATDTVKTTISTGAYMNYPVVRPDGSALYVPGDGGLLVIDTASNKVRTTIPVADLTEPVVLPNGSALYGVKGAAVQVIDTATDEVTATVPVGGQPWAPVMLPDGSAIYVPDGDAGTMSVIDTATNTVTDTITVGEYPAPVALPDGSAVYVAVGGPEQGAVKVLGAGTGASESPAS